MIYLLEVKLIGTGWLPKRILDEGDIHQALDNLIIDRKFQDWRVRKIEREDISEINAQILMKWS